MAVATGANELAFQYICSMVAEMSAILVDSKKSYLIDSRLGPLLRRRNFASLSELVAALAQGGAKALRQEVLEAMTTNETSFFRDMHPFEALKNTVFPRLIERRRHDRKISIWSNACSSGQEPFTLAMILKENFPELRGWKIEMIGSDLDSQMLQRASTGMFNQAEVNRGLPMQLLLKYFDRCGIAWQIKQEIRDMVCFRQINLVHPFPLTMPRMDVVLLRNVLIYFTAETKEMILTKIRKQMPDDGYLFLGGAESILNLNTSFTREQIGPSACFRPL